MRSLFVIIFILYSDAKIIELDQGKLNGTHLKTREGKIFNAFYGIPFAEPPVAQLRFKPPKEPKPWDGILDATVTPKECLQTVENSSDGIKGNEDCLNLNVYAPLNAQEYDKLPVIVFLLGGAFKWGTSLDFGPEYILQRDVILVMPNYRLGALGLMSTGDSIMSGNYQLKDQTMALKWIQKNIHHFGGDPNDVTLHGQSSGSMCVHLHTISALSKGLFHKAIMQSGSSMGHFFEPDVMRAIAKEFAIKAGCPSTATSEDMLSCFMTLDANVFPEIERTMYIWDENPSAIFQPTIEDTNSTDAFITVIPNKAEYHTPNMPWIIGLTTAEASYKVAKYVSNDGKLAAELDKYYKLLFPISLSYLWHTNSKYLDYTSQMLRIHYFGDRTIDAQTSHEMTEFYTHGMFGISIIKSIRSYPGPKYVYWYDYKSNYSNQNILAYYEEYLGVAHSDDIYLLFYTKNSDDVLTNRDKMFSKELVKRWMNFVQTGNPNLPVKINEKIMSYWTPMITDRIEYLYINLNGSMETDLYKDTYEFWAGLPIGVK